MGWYRYQGAISRFRNGAYQITTPFLVLKGWWTDYCHIICNDPLSLSLSLSVQFQWSHYNDPLVLSLSSDKVVRAIPQLTLQSASEPWTTAYKQARTVLPLRAVSVKQCQAVYCHADWPAISDSDSRQTLHDCWEKLDVRDRFNYFQRLLWIVADSIGMRKFGSELERLEVEWIRSGVFLFLNSS